MVIQNENIKKRVAFGKKAGITGSIVNLILFAVKLAAGIFSGSIATLTDALNNLSDAAVSVITYAGFKLSEKPADSEHPYGHARMEYIAAFCISIVILFIGLQTGMGSVRKIIDPVPPTNLPFLVPVLAVSVAVKGVLWIYYARIYKKSSSLALKGAADDSRNDMAATTAILLSILIHSFTGYVLDGYMGLVISGMIIIFGINLIRKTITPLLGEAPPAEMVDQIEKRVLSFEGIQGVHDLHIHSYGPGKYFASVDCEISPEKKLVESHELADKIEKDILETTGIELVVHIDPVETNEEQVRKARDMVAEIVKGISTEYSIHDFRFSRKENRLGLMFDLVIPFETDADTEKIKERIDREIRLADPRYFSVITFDKGNTCR